MIYDKNYFIMQRASNMPGNTDLITRADLTELNGVAEFIATIGTGQTEDGQTVTQATNPRTAAVLPTVPEILRRFGDQSDAIDQAASEQRDQFAATFTAQFAYAYIGNISDVVGDLLLETDKLNAYQFPDDSDNWYGPIQSQSFPITIPADPSNDDGWAVVSSVTREWALNTFSNANLLSNHNFLIASPDDSQPPPDATPRSYPPGFQIFSGVFANETTGIISLTNIDGRLSFSGGDFYMPVANTDGIERLTEFVASVADFDGKSRTRGVSFALVGDEYRVTVGVDALTDAGGNDTPLGSVKFEQGSAATGHEVIESIASSNISTYTDLVFDGVADMITGVPKITWSSSTIGTQVTTGSSSWRQTSFSSPMTIADFTPLNFLYADDFTGGLSEALDSATPGDVIFLSDKDYNIAGKYFLGAAPGVGFSGNEVKNLTIIGSRMPRRLEDLSQFESGSGSVVQGALINFADGFQCHNVGIDVGQHVVDNLNAGAWMEGFIPSTHKLNTSWDDFVSGGYIKDVHWSNISVLAKNPVPGDVSTFKHALLFEYCDTGSHGYAEVVGGFFGFVMKSRNISANGIVKSWGDGSSSSRALCKSDQYTQCSNYRGGEFVLGSEKNTSPPNNGFMFTAQDGVHVDGVSLNVDAIFTRFALREEASAGGGRVKGVTVGSLTSRFNSINNAVKVTINCDDWVFGNHLIQDFDGADAFVVDNGAARVNIGDGSVVRGTGTEVNGYNLSAIASHGNIRAEECSGWGVFNDGLALVNPYTVTTKNNILGGINTLNNAVDSSGLINGWEDKSAAENAVFGLRTFANIVDLNGKIGGTTITSSTILLVPEELRPKGNKRWYVFGNGSGGAAPILIEYNSISSTLVCNDFALIQGASVAYGLDLSPISWEVGN